MILSNVLIQQALDSGRLIIDPEPQPRKPTEGQECLYDTHSVDLTLGSEIVLPGPGPFVYDLMEPGSLAEFISRNSEKRRLDDQGFRLERNRFVLGKTRETIRLPILPDSETCLAARIEGKSSRARCGLLIHFTAPTVHPGFEGSLTLEMINLGPAAFMLRPGMPIAQLIVEEVKGIPFQNPSQFQSQASPEGKRG